MFKKLMAFLIVMIAFTGIFISCSDDDDSSSTGPDTTAPTVWVAAPADSSEVISGLTVMITAGVSDNVGVSKVEFLVDGIVNWVDSIPSAFSYEFSTVGREVRDYEVYLKAYDAAGNVGESAKITIIITPEQNLEVTSPNGPEEWRIGSIQEIRWNSNTVDSLVKIELYRNLTKIITIVESTENDSYFLWTIPTDLTLANDYLVRVEGLSTTVNDYSNDGFSITNTPFIQVVSPNGGETWTMNTEYEIKWQDNLAEDVKIELFRASTLELAISDTTDSDGSYMWTVPNTLTAGSNYKLKITCLEGDPVISDDSEASFAITAK